MDRKLAELLAGVFGMRLSEIGVDLTKEDVGTWDSLKQMDLVLTLEREYAITLVIADIIRMTTVAAIIGVLQEKGVTLEH